MDTKPKNNNKEDEDITRIEDLSPFEHDELSDEGIEDVAQEQHQNEDLDFFSPSEVDHSPSSADNTQESNFDDFAATPSLEDDNSFDSNEQNPMESLGKEVEAIHLTPTTLVAEPPFSLLISEINTETDKVLIRSALKRVGLYEDQQMGELYERSLNRGSVLITHLSEYLANYLYQDLLKTSCKLFAAHSHQLDHAQTTNEPQGESYGSMQLNQTEQENFDDPDRLLVSATDQIHGQTIVEIIGPLIQTLWIEESVKNLATMKSDLRRLPSIFQEVRMRKGNAITQWKVELVKTGKERQQQILCSGIIVKVDRPWP